MRRTLLLLLSLFLFNQAYTQETWDLVRCIRHALDNNIDVELAELALEMAALDLKETRHSRYPSLNAGSNFGINFGRAINPNTNQFETENSIFQSISGSSSALVFAGGRITNSIRQADIEANASEEELRQVRNNLALQVASTYLSILLAEENLINARARLDLVRSQLDQIDKLIDAGSRPEGERFDLVAQVASTEHEIVLVENDFVQNMLALKHMLRLDPDYPMSIEKPAIDIDNIERLELTPFEAIYNAALANQPDIQASELRKQSAGIGVPLARSFQLPTLSAGASAGTSFSDVAQQVSGFSVQRVAVPGVFINNELVNYEVLQQIPTGIENIPYFTQFDNNFGYGLSLSLNIPIYNNYSARANVERAKLGVLRASEQHEQIKQNLKTNIQTALSAARSSREALEAAQRSLDANEIARQHAQRRYDLGNANTYELLQAQNRYDQAVVSLSVAKYDYLFRIKVLEYYLGRGLTLEDF